MYQKYIKRLIDIVVSLAGLILASWLYLLIIIAQQIDENNCIIVATKKEAVLTPVFSC